MCHRRLCLMSALGALALGAATVVDTVRTREIAATDALGAELCWDFSETDDGTGVVRDASGHAREGRATGCCWTDAGRFSGGACQFMGNASGISAGKGLDVPAWERYSVSVWFLHDGGGDRGPGYGHKILDKSSPNHDWYLALHPSGRGTDTGSIVFTLREGACALTLGDAACDYGDGAWHHLVVTRAGAHGELWLDGELCDTSDALFGVTNNVPLRAGNSNSPDHFQRLGWSGLLDEIQVFDHALTGDEIEALFLGTTAGGGTVRFVSDVSVEGSLAVSGAVRFSGSVRWLRPLGDLSCGTFANGENAK